MEFHANPPLTLYVHLPWCVRKCPYCDFNSHEAPEALPAEAYVDALIADLEQELPDVWGRPLEAVFIGGGTPSLFPPAAIERLLSRVRAYFNPDPEIEITLEANPGTAEAASFAGFREAGVNRLSLGIQSFDDEMLAALGRIHDGDAARAAVERAFAAGFERVNLDLMYALPGQDVARAEQDLASAIALGTGHVSWYQLTLEPNTVFWSKPPTGLPDEDAIADMETAGHATLRGGGFERYEISAWARGAGMRCDHNLNYWYFGDYLGIGAGAHGKLTLPMTGAIERRAKIRAPQSYLEKAAGAERVAARRRLSAADAAFEFLLNALRLPGGFSPALFTERTGVPLAWLKRPAEATERGLLEQDAEGVRPTERGLELHNDLLALFAAETESWGAGREAAAGLRIVPQGPA